MSVLAAGLGLFLAAFALHLVWWRIATPSRGIVALLGLFLGLLAAALGGLCLPAARAALGLPIPGIVHAGLLYLSLALAYIVLFTALDEDSPSASMVKFAALSGESGREPDEFAHLITDDLIITSRLESMVRSGFVALEGDRYRLANQGRFWNRIFSLFHRVFALPRGG